MNEENSAFFSELKKSYKDRCKDPKAAHAVWKKSVKQFPPDRLDTYETRPSFLLARRAGDMGLALIWIVQAALTRPLIKAFLDSEQNPETRNLLKQISGARIGALAISEDKTRPLIVQSTKGTLALDGEKKYITGGSFSDFILMAGRYPKEEKLSCMFLLPARDIPENAFKELDLGCFYTSRHARLALEAYHPPAAALLSATPSMIRKQLLIWGIIERSMIMESLAGLVIYLAEKVSEKSGETIVDIRELESGLGQISREINQQIQSARNGDFVKPLSPMPKHLIFIMKHLKKIYENGQDHLSDELLYRYKDMFFFKAAFSKL